MELDDLKAGWQKETETYSQLNKKDMEQLQSILKRKTSGVLVKVKKKYEAIISILFIGICANIVISPFLHWILGDAGPVFRMPSLLSLLTIITISILSLFFYWIKYISLETNIVSGDLKNTLLENINRLNRSFKHECWFFIMFFIVLFVAGRSTSQFRGNGEFWDIFRTDIMLSILAGCLLLACGLFIRAKHYQKNIRELNAYLSEFNKD